MTENEIVIALRAVAEKYKGKFVATFKTNINAMATDAADHIERLCEENNFLKAEIERLKPFRDAAYDALKINYFAIKTEAIREFAEKLKEKTGKAVEFMQVCVEGKYQSLANIIDNLVKETEENDEIRRNNNSI